MAGGPRYPASTRFRDPDPGDAVAQGSADRVRDQEQDLLKDPDTTRTRRDCTKPAIQQEMAFEI